MTKSSTAVVICSLWALMGLLGCASATKFSPASIEGRERYGYSIQAFKAPEKADVYVAHFEGNSSTSEVKARTYAILAAQQQCSRNGQSAVIVHGPQNYSKTQVSAVRLDSLTMVSGQHIPTVEYIELREDFPRYGLAFSCVEKIASSEESRRAIQVAGDLKEGDILVRAEEVSGSRGGLNASVIRDGQGQSLATRILSESPEVKKISSREIR